MGFNTFTTFNTCNDYPISIPTVGLFDVYKTVVRYIPKVNM